MGIKSIFSMLKADRYTQDGRDKLAEDKTYQTGQISEKTGLQKQPDGSWAPPKNGNGKTMRPGEPNPDRDDSPERAAYERELSRQQAQRAADDPRGFGYEEPPMEPAAGSKPAGADLSKVTHSDLDVARNKMNTTPEEDQMLDYFVTEMHEDNTGLDEIIKRQDGVFERSNGAYPEEEKTYKSLRDKIMKHYSGDSAPRQLTGDTRLRLSQVTDKIYQIGEISQKTGLQKTAKGWRPVKKGAAPDKPAESKPAGATGNEEQRKRKNFMENSQKHFEAANSVATTETDKANLKKIKSFMDEEHGTFKNALYNNAESLVRKGSNGAPDRENEKSLLKFAEAAGMGDDLKLYLKEEVNSKYEFGGGDAEKKPDGADRHDQVGGEIKGNLEAAKYYFDKAQSFSTTDPSYKTYMGKAKEYNDKAKAQADDYGFDFEEMHNSGVTRAVNKYTEEQSKPAEKKPAAPKPSVQEYMKAQDTVKKYEETYKKQLEEYENGQRLRANGGGAILDPMYGLKPNDLSKNEEYQKAKDIIQRMEARDSAPLTGDTKIKVRRK